MRDEKINISGESAEQKINSKRKVPLRSLQSDWIFDGAKEVLIAHGDQEYRLRITRAGKLILTK